MSETSEEELNTHCEISVSGVVDILSNKSGQLLDPKETVKRSRATHLFQEN